MVTKLIPDQDFGVISPQNLLTNGGFEQWNFGTTFAPPSNLAYVANEWAIEHNGAPTIAVTQESGAGNFDTGSYSAKLNVTALGGSTFIQLRQSIPNYADYKGKYLSLSVRVKSNAAADIWITDGISGSGSSAHTGDNTWQTLTATDLIASNASYVQVWLRLQSTGIAYFDSAMFVVGSRPMNFAPDNAEIDKVKAGGMSSAQSNAANLIANGGFENWGRTFYETNVQGAGIFFGADKWVHYQAGGSPATFILSKETTEVQSGYASLKMQVTAAGSPTTQQIYQSFTDTIGSYPRFKSKTVTLSAKVKTTIANKIKLEIGFYGGASTSKASPFHTGSGNWETLSVTHTAASTLTGCEIRMGFINTAVEVGTIYFDDVMMSWGEEVIPFVDTDYELDKVKVGAITDLQRNVPNLLINGGMEVWQRGTTFTTPAPASKTADGWAVDYSGTVSGHTCIFSREAGAGNVEGRYSMKLDYQVKGLTSAARLYQFVGDAYGLQNKRLSVQVRVKTTVANGFRMILADGVNNYSAYHTGSGNWETLTVASTSSATGSRYVYLQAEAVGVYYIDSVNMVIGNQALEYVPEEPAIEMLRCQRWYETGVYYNSLPIYHSTGPANQVYGSVSYAVPKLTTPTITTSGNGGTLFAVPGVGTGAAGDTTWSAPSTNTVTAAKFHFVSTRGADQTTYQAIAFGFSWTAEVV